MYEFLEHKEPVFVPKKSHFYIAIFQLGVQDGGDAGMGGSGF